jgi:hypothetical protein
VAVLDVRYVAAGKRFDCSLRCHSSRNCNQTGNTDDGRAQAAGNLRNFKRRTEGPKADWSADGPGPSHRSVTSAAAERKAADRPNVSPIVWPASQSR